MGIKCSLLGHDFDEATVERDREEQGSEVVITIREVETCARCGETKVVSENKEVTTLETPEDIDAPAPSEDDASDDPESVAAEDTEDDQTTDDSATEPSPVVEAEPDADSAEIVDETESDDTEAETPTVETETEPPVTDDAEILDDNEEDTPEREPGEWPQEADEETSHDEEDFDQYGYMDDEDDEETDAADNRDAEFIDEDTDADIDDDTGGSEPVQTTNAWPSEEDAADAGGESAPSGPGAVTVPDGEFVCQACGFSTPVESSSLREGDFCPECHKDTLVQRREQ